MNNNQLGQCSPMEDKAFFRLLATPLGNNHGSFARNRAMFVRLYGEDAAKQYCDPQMMEHN